MSKSEFRKILQMERKRQGLTQNELAEMTGFTKRTIQYWESGTRGISLENADIIAKALGITYEIGKESKNAKG